MSTVKKKTRQNGVSGKKGCQVNFSWTNAYPDVHSTPTTNPNIARRTILSSQVVTVSVTVTSNGESETRSRTLRGDI